MGVILQCLTTDQSAIFLYFFCIAGLKPETIQQLSASSKKKGKKTNKTGKQKKRFPQTLKTLLYQLLIVVVHVGGPLYPTMTFFAHSVSLHVTVYIVQLTPKVTRTCSEHVLFCERNQQLPLANCYRYAEVTRMFLRTENSYFPMICLL